jgi:predicted permease
MNNRRERELAEEIQFHKTMRERKYREQYGMSAKDAADKAKRDFGGFEKWKEVCRDVGRWRLLDEFGRDLALALRMLRKSPVFTVVALLTLTLAVGANTAIFSLMNAVMLKALPVPDVHRLVLLAQPQERSGYSFHHPLFQQLERQSEPVVDIFGFSRRNVQLQDNEGVSIVQGVLVTGHYFSALQVQPELGRWIGPDDDRPGAPHGAVAVVSNRFWRTRMSGEASALGRKLILNRAVYTVVGVMPKSFRGMEPDERPDVFLPLELEPAVDAPFDLIKAGPRAWWIQAGGRLRNGVSREQANAFLKTNSARFLDKPPEHSSLIAEPGERGLSLLRLRFKKPLMVMMGLVSLVLLIACLNLATLLMARAASRGREMTTRLALGASRGRLLRQLLTETLLLATSGSALGFALSPLLAHILVAMLSQQHNPAPIAVDATPDTMVFLFTAGIAILATVLTGTVPALQSTGGVLQAGLREGSSALRGVDRRRLWPRMMMSLEVALALVLVTGASLLGYSLVKLHVTPAGFNPNGLVYLPMDLTKHPINSLGMASAYREIVDEIRKLPNVADASVVSAITVSSAGMQEDLRAPSGELRHVWRNSVGPGYFETMRIPLLRGRDLRWTDGSPERKVIVNRSAARLLFPKGGELGRRIVFQNGKTEAEVVGVVEDSKSSNLRDVAPPTVYSAAVPQDALLGMAFTIVVRTNGTPAPLITAARRIVQRILPDIPLPAAFSMEQLIADSTATERILATLALFFGGLALLMTGIGLYGTLAYTTERRTGEIGIRLALGATPTNVISLVCAENGAITLFGCVIGIVGSAVASKTIASFLYGVSPKDPVVFGFAALLLLGVAAAASVVPAVRASKIDPIAAIRYE